MKLLTLLALIVICLGCGGSGESVRTGPPVMFDLSITPIESNADPTPLNDLNFLEIRRFANFTNPPQVSIRAYFTGRDSQARLLILGVPIESQLVRGATFSFRGDDRTSLTVNDNPDSIFPNYGWGNFDGQLEVTNQEGRVVTLNIDALGNHFNEGTGQLRVQGTVIIDFARQPSVDLE